MKHMNAHTYVQEYSVGIYVASVVQSWLLVARHVAYGKPHASDSHKPCDGLMTDIHRLLVCVDTHDIYMQTISLCGYT